LAYATLLDYILLVSQLQKAAFLVLLFGSWHCHDNRLVSLRLLRHFSPST